LLGSGPQRIVDTTTLKNLVKDFLDRGTPNQAKKVEISYDLTTGSYKGSEKSFQVNGAKALAKSAEWTTSQHWYSVGFPTSWQDSLTDGQWGGDANFGDNVYGTSYIHGFKPLTTVVNGVTPSLYFRVTWRGSRYWTAWKSWNEAASTVDGNFQQWMQSFQAYSSYKHWNVCYAARTQYEDAYYNPPLDMYQYGCGNTQQVGSPGYDLEWFDVLSLKFVYQ